MDKIDDLLTRGVDQILPSKEELEKVLRRGKKLRVYQGFDPSAPQLHIGHMIGLRKLKQWQDLGHEVIFLIGDFTGRIGDPTGREKTRPLLSKETVEENAKTYKDQAGKILNFTGKNPVIVKFNSEWLEGLSMQEVLNLAAQVTYQQILKRDLIQKMLQKEGDISINEIMYPILQGYDSVVMDIDVEIGGRDQLFNMMMGRHLMHKMKRKNKFVMTTPLLVDAQGNKIGKTEGNATALIAPPNQIFGAIMTFPDEIIVPGLEYLTDVSQKEIQNIEKSIKSGQNPLQFKKKLAFEVVKQLSGEEKARKAQKEFESVFQKKLIPEGAAIVEPLVPDQLLIDFLAKHQSKSQSKRLLEQGAIEVDGVVTKDPRTVLNDGQIVRIGKKKFVKVKIEK